MPLSVFMAFMGGFGMGYDEKYMGIALQQAQTALARGEFPVGCVIVSGDEIVAEGARSNTAGRANEIDHAEINALRSLSGGKRVFDMSELVVYCTLEPCLMCYSTLIVNGVRNIVYAYEDAMGGGTNLPLEQLAPLYAGVKMNLLSGMRRDESLHLFQKFFKSSSTNYLHDTLLCRYTLEQKNVLKESR